MFLVTLRNRYQVLVDEEQAGGVDSRCEKIKTTFKVASERDSGI